MHGIVRRLTDFGAFVDLGGVDGLIHVTDLSWAHVKHPSEIVSPDQEVDVKILSLDPERERIQLGLKQLQPKPWDMAPEKYPAGAVVTGKVVRITTFGAFVELEPGIDGLVHISQCAPTRINKVEDAVNVGDVVNVKVLSIDPEAKRISLSIRALMEPEPAPVEEAPQPAYEDDGAEAVPWTSRPWARRWKPRPLRTKPTNNNRTRFPACYGMPGIFYAQSSRPFRKKIANRCGL